jgi:hypothetical protein
MRITALARGGVSVYGGHYDPHRNEAIVSTRDDEIIAVVIEYPSAPTSPTVTVSGMSATSPTVSGNKVSFTLSGISDAGRADVLATVGGEARKIVIRSEARSLTDRYEFGPDYIGS